MEHDDSSVSDTSKQNNSWFLLDDSDVEVCEEATQAIIDNDDDNNTTIHASFVIKSKTEPVQDRRLIEEIVPWDDEPSDSRVADAATPIDDTDATTGGVVPEKCTSCAAAAAAARRQTEHTASYYNTFLAICVIGVGTGMALYFQSDPDLSFLSTTYSAKDVAYRPSASYYTEHRQHKYDKDGSGKSSPRKYAATVSVPKVRYIPRQYQVTYDEHKDRDYSSKDYKKLKERSRRNDENSDKDQRSPPPRQAKGNNYKYDRKTGNKEYYRGNEKNRYKSVTGKSYRKEY